jgi:hypothetical protein
MADRVEFDERGVTRTRGEGSAESVSWAELEEVVILTTAHGPLADDVFWLLKGARGGCAVPSEAAGMDALLARLQALPGFDNEAVISAMACTEEAAFLCWRRGSPPASG